MKVCIVTDSIDKFDSTRVLVDTLCNIADEVEIACLYMSKTSVIIPVSLRKIYSSYLSRFYKSTYSLFKYPLFTEQVAKRFKLPEADFYFFISQGFSHLAKVPAHSKAYYYFPDIPVHFHKQGFYKNKLFNKFQEKIEEIKFKAFASQKIGEILSKPGFDVIAPAFQSRDFPKINENRDQSKQILLNIDRLSEYDESKLSFLCEKDYEVVVITNLSVQKVLRKNHKNLRVLTSVSNQETYIELLKSCLFIEFSRRFSEKAFAALSTGVPCLINEDNRAIEYINDEVGCSFKEDDFDENLSAMMEKLNTYDAQVLRRFALRFNERVFKSKVQKIISNL